MVFEPVGVFFENCNASIPQEAKDKIAVFSDAVGASNGYITIFERGDSSGFVAHGGIPQQARVFDVASIASARIDLIKLNIEGMEYEVLQRLIDTGLVKNLVNIQVQFHFNFPGAQEAYQRLTQELNKTHTPEWDSAPVWQNWRLR